MGVSGDGVFTFFYYGMREGILLGGVWLFQFVPSRSSPLLCYSSLASEIDLTHKVVIIFHLTLGRKGFSTVNDVFPLNATEFLEDFQVPIPNKEVLTLEKIILVGETICKNLWIDHRHSSLTSASFITLNTLSSITIREELGSSFLRDLIQGNIVQKNFFLQPW